jgi:hypothetical protein
LIQALFSKLKFTQFEFKDLYYILNLLNWLKNYKAFRKDYKDYLIGDEVKDTPNLVIKFEFPKETDINKFATYYNNDTKSVDYPFGCLRGIHV